MEHLRRGADLVSVVLRGVGWQERELGARPVARVAETLAAADEQADRVYATTRALYDEASELRRKVRYVTTTKVLMCISLSVFTRHYVL